MNRKKQERNEKNCEKIQRMKKKRKGGFGRSKEERNREGKGGIDKRKG